ncbi:MAG: SAM-dependent methyltransferase [Xanthobacteraceae bacterium]
METPLKRTDTAMEGDGYYNRNSAMQAAGIARVLPIWEKISASVPVGDETLVIADYGSSQGRNSMAPMRVAIAALRAKAGPDRVVEVIHTDLPSNDFASLFQAIAEEPESYLKGATKVFPSAVGRSYFDPVIAPGTVHLGWNSWTLQWLSRNPVEVSDHVLAAFSADKAAQLAVREQSAQDWRDFIAARASELRRGAKLFCLFAAADDNRRTWAWLFGELWGAAVEMNEAGLLTEHELMRVTLPLASRTLADIEEPFKSEGEFGGMAVEHADVVITPDPFWADFERSGDAAQLGRSWAGIWRGVVGPTLAAALRPERDRTAVLDQLFSKFATRIAASPREQQNAIALVTLRKN